MDRAGVPGGPIRRPRWRSPSSHRAQGGSRRPPDPADAGVGAGSGAVMFSPWSVAGQSDLRRGRRATAFPGEAAGEDLCRTTHQRLKTPWLLRVPSSAAERRLPRAWPSRSRFAPPPPPAPHRRPTAAAGTGERHRSRRVPTAVPGGRRRPLADLRRARRPLQQTVPGRAQRAAHQRVRHREALLLPANRDFTYTARGLGRGTSWDTRAAAGVRALPTPDRLSPAAGRTGHSPCARPCFLRDRSTA